MLLTCIFDVKVCLVEKKSKGMGEGEGGGGGGGGEGYACTWQTGLWREQHAWQTLWDRFVKVQHTGLPGRFMKSAAYLTGKVICYRQSLFEPVYGACVAADETSPESSFFLAEFKLALVQLAVGASKVDNVTRAVAMVKQAASAGAKLIALPVSVWWFTAIWLFMSWTVWLKLVKALLYDLSTPYTFKLTGLPIPRRLQVWRFCLLTSSNLSVMLEIWRWRQTNSFSSLLHT